METIVPKTSAGLTALLRADFLTQWRNRRAVVLTMVVPIIILTSWKGLIDKVGGAFVLSNSITIGLFASGLMGYTISISRDRDKGIFQRLRVAPIPSWAIITSRLLVQLGLIFIIVTAVFVIGKEYDNITLSPAAYAFAYFTSIIGGALALSLGQMIVGWIKNPETVNATTRLVYIAFMISGIFGEILQFDDKASEYTKMFVKAVQWSPYGTVKTILASSMQPNTWNSDTTSALLVTVLYCIVFATLGIKWFKWNTK